MITGLKDDTLIERVGGRFRLATLIQRRMVELLQGARDEREIYWESRFLDLQRNHPAVAVTVVCFAPVSA